MIKLVFCVFFLLTSINICAYENMVPVMDYLECSNYLNKNKTLYIYTHEIDVIDYYKEPTKADNPLVFSKNSIKSAFARHACKNVIDFVDDFSGCAYIHPDKETSLSCYLESSFGYFFVVLDAGGGIHIIFSNWEISDRYRLGKPGLVPNLYYEEEVL